MSDFGETWQLNELGANWQPAYLTYVPSSGFAKAFATLEGAEAHASIIAEKDFKTIVVYVPHVVYTVKAEVEKRVLD